MQGDVHVVDVCDGYFNVLPQKHIFEFDQLNLFSFKIYF